MADYDVLIIGGGPAGYAAALKAAEFGANVALIEAEKPGGACVHHACIPTEILLDAAMKHVEARELSVLGLFEAGERFNFAAAVARKDTLVRQVSEGIRAALRLRKVTVIEGRASFSSPNAVSVDTSDGRKELSAEAFVIATGTRWEPAAIPHLADERILTADGVQTLTVAPKSAVVLGGGPCEVDFALEYAALLAIAGSDVTLLTPQARILPALDHDLSAVARMAMTDLGVRVIEGLTEISADGNEVVIHHGGEEARAPAEIVVAADVRHPYFATLNLAAAGVIAGKAITVDRTCRTNVPHIFAAGDVTGELMLSSAASHMGEVAAANATGGEAHTRLAALPRVLHGFPDLAWVGKTEESARTAGYDVVTGIYDLSYGARAITLGARKGIAKVIAERGLGQILGVHVAGPGAGEMVAVASGLMQAEATIDDLAAMVAWHPSMTEGLVEAARRALA